MMWIAVVLGGAVGTAARHALNLATTRLISTPVPWATAAVNMIGSLVIGVLAGAIAAERLSMSPWVRTFLFVGILGGFTTFSTFGLDTLLLARTHSTGYALLNVGVQVAGGLAAVWSGYRLGVSGV